MSVATAQQIEQSQSTRESLLRQMRHRRLVDQLGRLLVLVALVLTVATYLLVPFASLNWARQPFLGAYVDYSLFISGLPPTGNVPFTGQDAGLANDERILSIDGQAITRSRELHRYLNQRQVGDTVTLQMLSTDGVSTRDVAVTLMTYPAGDFVNRFGVPFLTGLVYIAAGVWVYRSRREQASARAFMMLCMAMAGILGLVFAIWTWQSMIALRLWTLALPVTAGSLIALGMVFPHEIRAATTRPFLRLIPHILTIVLAAYMQIRLTMTPSSYVSSWQIGYYFGAFSAAMLIGLMLYRSITAASPIAREQARVVLAGSAVAFTPMIYWALRFAQTPNQGPLLFVLVSFGVFPMAIGYAILRYRLLNSQQVMRLGLTYAVIGALVIGSYTLLVTGASLVVGSAVSANSPVLIGVVVFATLVLFNPLRTRLQDAVDRVFFRTRDVYESKLQTLTHDLTVASDLIQVIDVLRLQVEQTIHPTHMYVFLRQQDSGDFGAFSPNGMPQTDIRFDADGALSAVLQEAGDVIYLEPGESLPAQLVADQTALAVLRTPVLASLRGQNQLTGWLAIGPKRSGETYTMNDLRYVERLTDQAALAVERAQVVGDLERRVRELDVLSQVSQAVNFTLNFNDLLELIYAQASKVTETANFYIMLYDQRANELSYAFYLEHNERFSEREGLTWNAAMGLAGQVVKSGRPIRTDNYIAECARRGVQPVNAEYQAWMGAPLNVGLSTLGTMVVTSFRRGEVFTDEQLKVFWAIADQAASALDKARLFADAEARSRQLATLNEISRTLSSTLDIEQLLSLIMKSAVDILDGEAGSLLLTDPETDELVFRVMEGGATELVGTRLPSGAGVVGFVAQSGEPVIVEDAATDDRWFKDADKDTGFTTKSIIAVPLQVQDTVIGVLELLNRLDGSSFNHDDATLLATFASQAAVAIENARLYQATDEELADRVDELAMLQRIDRELNTTLDTNRVVQITLDWALRVSGASAGAVGMVDEEGTGLLMLATQGHAGRLDEFRNVALPIPRNSILERVIENHKPELLEDVSGDPFYEMGMTADAQTQITVPIMRVNEVIGLLMLESAKDSVLTIEDLNFITRLTEHASVAISNARLFQQVEAANLAKTEFVSFVSHELKTPMTSIKGYTDLLMSGSVGSVDDMQRQFLMTIRSNVDRMARLVSDLADTSRIESGHLRLEMTPIPFGLVVEDTLRSMQALIDEKSQQLETHMPDDLPLVFADHSRQVQVLTNLISNAYKYTPENGQIYLSAEPTVETDEDGNEIDVVAIAVRDTGIGMSPEDLEQLFTKFFRSNSVKGTVPGTGLGLNITKNLIELHGGRVWVESEVGVGTTFAYTIPIATQDAQDTMQAEAEEETTEG